MMRNDYRRALILLRSGEPGCSGHVRLERRTLMGSMYFMVQAPQEDAGLQAALVGRGRGEYYACVLGQLKGDGRGQAVLSHSFDPRNLCGRELEAYQLIVVAAVSGGDCRILLYGNVDGHAELNWERVQQAVCLTLGTAPESPCAPMPREEKAQQDEVVTDAALPDAEPTGDGFAGEERQPETKQQGIERLEALPEPAPLAVAEGNGGKQPAEPTAAEQLGTDMTLPWPEEIGGLKALFQEAPPLQDAPENGYVYAAAPLPEGSPYAYLAVGLRAENGRPVAVSYALPAPYTPEPPAGLEAHRWLGDSSRGWWVSEIDLLTGGQI